MPRKPTGRPTGRPRKDREALEAVALIQKTGVTEEEAAKAKGIGARTLRRAKAATPRGASGAPKAPPSGSHVGAIGKVELPQGGAVSGRPDLLELVRRILDARNGAARAELDEGLAVHVAGGEAALAPWLARPIRAVEIDRDELVTLREGLGFALGVARTAEAGGPQLRALGILDRLAKSVSVVSARRPRDERPDEVDERVRGAMDACVDHLLRHTREAAAKLERDRAELAAWASTNLGPRLAAELERSVGAMLTGGA